MLAIDLQAGDRIRFIYDVSYYDLSIVTGTTAKVLGIDFARDVVALEFDIHIEKLYGLGHSCSRKGKDGYCWNFGIHHLDNNFEIVQSSNILDWPT